MERENRSIGGGERRGYFVIVGEGRWKGCWREGRQCLVQRKRLDRFREGAKGTELERSVLVEDGVFQGWVMGVGRQSLHFLLSKDCCKYFYINVLAVLLSTPILCRLLRQARSIVLEVRLDKRGRERLISKCINQGPLSGMVPCLSRLFPCCTPAPQLSSCGRWQGSLGTAPLIQIRWLHFLENWEKPIWQIHIKAWKFTCQKLKIREMQIETSLRCHFTLIRLAKIKCCDNQVLMRLWGNHLYTASGNVNGYSHHGE